ncbi:hypothetical protein AHAS_AhasUnG0017500 [Arachis hypogaea]
MCSSISGVKTLALDSLAISMPPSQGRESLPSLMTPTFAKVMLFHMNLPEQLKTLCLQSFVVAANYVN